MGLHGLVGCVSAAATGADCAAGALGGVVQSIYAGTLDGKGPAREDYASDEAYAAAFNDWKAKVATVANLIGGVVGYVFSGGSAANVSATASIAKSGILNNYLSHTEIAKFIQEMEDCGFEDRDCREAVKAKYHDFSEINLAEMQACKTQECWEVHAGRIREAQSAVNDLYNSAFPQDAAMNVVNIDLSNFVNAEQRGSGQSFWLQNNAAEVFGAWGAENCGGLMDQMCMMSFTQSRLHDSFMAAAEMGVDFLPVIGDAKGFAECGMELSLGSCLGAVAGLIPFLGDGAKILLKRGDDVIEVVADGAGGLHLVGDGKSIAGHGTINENLDGSLPMTVVPEGTSITIPIGQGNELYDEAGQLIESGDIFSGMNFQFELDPDSITGAQTFLEGAEVPNYLVHPGPDLNLLEGSVMVPAPTNLSDILQPNMGCMNLATCTSIFPTGTTFGN